jgi:hypothetical protein
MNSLTKPNPPDLPAIPQHEESSLLDMIARAAADPHTDVVKMERLYAMLQTEQKRIAEREFNRAMARAQAQMPMVTKDAINPNTNSHYVKLESLCIAAAPTITREGFSLQFGQEDCPIATRIRVACEVSHSQGHSKWFHVDLSPDDTGQKGAPSKTKIHGEGSTFTYGRRYLTVLIFNMTILGEDDDGNRGFRLRPAGPNLMEPSNAKTKKLAAELWAILKPVRGSERKWDTANQWLWREEILDGAIPESAPDLTPERFDEVIKAAKERLSK